MGSQASTEATLTMAPDRCAIRSANAEARANGPNRLVSNSSRRSVVSGTSTDTPREMPALLISTLTSVAVSAAAATESASLTSSRNGTTRGSVTSTESGLRAAAYTFATPRPSSWSTYSRPIPRLAPVTSTA